MQLPWLTLSTGAVAVLIFLAPDSIVSGLPLDRDAFFRGAFWQPLTAHLTHWNLDHLIWDVVMFGIVGALVEMRSRKAWLLLNLISALAISGAVLLFRPDLHYYRGLSGLDMALAGFGVFVMFQDSRMNRFSKERWMWGGALILLCVKPLVEIVLGNALFVSKLGEGVENVALTHLLGVVVGIGIGAFQTMHQLQTEGLLRRL